MPNARLLLTCGSIWALSAACGDIVPVAPDAEMTSADAAVGEDDAAAVGEDDAAAVGEDADAAVGEDAAPALAIATTELPAAEQASAYEAELEARGGTPPYSWAFDVLPGGLSGASEGVIEGTPNEAGTHDVSVTVSDDGGETATTSLSLAVVPLPPFTSISSGGGSHTCALDEDGKAWCWGSNSVGQLGAENDSLEDSARPVAVRGNHTFEMISAGRSHTCAIDDEGDTWCWGSNGHGRLGIGEADSGPEPREVVGEHQFVHVVAGFSGTCAVDHDRDAWCWGRNAFGELGVPTDERSSSSEPVRVTEAPPLTELSASAAQYATCAWDDEEKAWCWGWNGSGRLGDGTDEESSDPVPVSGDHTFEVISMGLSHVCAVDDDGIGRCWGGGLHGKLGVGDDETYFEPTPIDGQPELLDIAAGTGHTCAVETDGSALCWGRNTGGQLGDGTDEASSTPVDVLGEVEFEHITSGGNHNCALDVDGEAWCWGRNGSGQLGTGDDEDRDEPTRVVLRQ